jgi:hypothetical protein
MNGIKNLIQNEPVLLVGLVQSAIAMATAFGLGWTAEQVAIVLAFTQTFLTVIARSMVTPTAKFDAAVNVEAENIAEAIVTEQAAPLTAEERASLDRLRAERDALRTEMRERGYT